MCVYVCVCACVRVRVCVCVCARSHASVSELKKNLLPGFCYVESLHHNGLSEKNLLFIFLRYFCF